MASPRGLRHPAHAGGSLILSFSALLLAWPLSLGLACALQDPRPAFRQKWLTGLIRFMTAIPTVVYGFAAVFLLTPLVREAAGQGSGLCWLSAACVLALLISPTMVLVMDVALREQMRRLLLPALSLGMSRHTVLACLALPAVRRWLLTAGLLGFGRAIGDTLIPLMLSGNAPNVPQNLFAGLRTLTAHMGLVTATDVGGPAYNSLFVAGGLLLCISTGVSLVLRRLEKKQDVLLPPVPALWRRHAPAGLHLLARGAGLLCSACVLALLGFLLWRGLPVLDAALLVGDAPFWPALLGRFPIWDGIWPACLGTLCLLGITMALVLVPGIGCGIYLAEYAPPRMQRLLNSLMDILSGVPSIVMGIFGFTLILFLASSGLCRGQLRPVAGRRLPGPAGPARAGGDHAHRPGEPARLPAPERGRPGPAPRPGRAAPVAAAGQLRHPERRHAGPGPLRRRYGRHPAYRRSGQRGAPRRSGPAFRSPALFHLLHGCPIPDTGRAAAGLRRRPDPAGPFRRPAPAGLVAA